MNYPYPEWPRHEVEALGVRTSYIVAGVPDRPLVVLVHGMSASSDTFREVMHELASEYWLVAPDIPGFGFSAETTPFTLAHLVEWLAAFRDALALPTMTLVGHSFGGALGTRFTLDYPEDVARLFLVAPAIKAGELVPDLLKQAALSLGLIELSDTISQFLPVTEEQAQRSVYDPATIHASVWARRIADYQRSRARGDVLKALAFEDMDNDLRRLEQPVCLLWGEEDPVLPAQHAYEISALLPNDQLLIWPGCGHMPFLEKPEQFLAVARAFFSGESVPFDLR